MSRASHPVDLYLLRVLTTVVAERSISRAAVRLNQSQPAVSTALRRLRQVFGDPLLVREGPGMVPTERAVRLAAQALAALAEIDRMLLDPPQFDAASTPQTFHVATPDYLATTFLARVVQRLRAQAPQARLVIHPLGPAFDHERALAEGDVDIVIGNWPQPPERMHMAQLLRDEVVCLLDARHALAGGMTATQYIAAPHLVPLSYSNARRGVVDSHLARLRLQRDARIMLPYFELAPYLLPGTDLVFTTARHFAEHFARMLPLAVVAAPFDFPPMSFYQLWHDRSHQQPSHRWLRLLIGECAAALEAGGAPADGFATKGCGLR